MVTIFVSLSDPEINQKIWRYFFVELSDEKISENDLKNFSKLIFEDVENRIELEGIK